MRNNIFGELAFDCFVYSKSVADVADMCYEDILKEVQEVRALRGDTFLKTDDEVVEIIHDYARCFMHRTYLAGW
jgi:hypothetical protein